MQRDTILKQVNEYIVQQMLDPNSTDLEETTPLLEWGILQSLELVRLLHFIQKQFGIDIPPDKANADHFINPGAIADLILAELSRQKGEGEK